VDQHPADASPSIGSVDDQVVQDCVGNTAIEQARYYQNVSQRLRHRLAPEIIMMV
jgi:hypothetical protein